MNQAVKEVAVTIMGKLNSLPEASSERCIILVPEKFRRANPESYTPQIVSIGPFHRKNKQLQAKEEIKLRYLKKFLSRIKADLMCCTRIVKESEDRIRDFYQERIELKSEEFVEMILVDAVFIIELFMRKKSEEFRDDADEVFHKQWMINGIFHDMLLLENQIPFFILERIYENSPMKFTTPFFRLTFEYFQGIIHGHELVNTNVPVKHLVDYVRALQVPSFTRQMPSVLKGGGGAPPPRGIANFQLTRSATELKEAGVAFRRADECSSMLDIRFRDDGILEMPHLVVHEWTEAYFRNVIAYEQCHHDHKYISSYVILMDSLINTPYDVDILVKSGILENHLGGTDHVANLFNSLYKETMTESSKFYYANLCETLNMYSRTRWHKIKAAWYRWKLVLKREYFHNPWAGVSVVAAVFLLVLTVVQTACSMIDIYTGEGRKVFRRRR